MKHLSLIFSTFVLVLYGCDKQTELRLMSYNIHNGIGMDNVTDYKRIADVIMKEKPDIVALQELDSITERSNVYVLEEVAKHTGMHYTFNASIPYRGGKYGIGILSKEKPISFKGDTLPGREEKRSLLTAEFKDYVFCCTHWSLKAEDRLASAVIVNSLSSKYNKPVFLAGDLNDVPHSAPLKELEKNWKILNDVSQNTIPVVNPDRCIDYISVRSKTPVKAVKTKVIDEQLASDHLPVVVDVKF